ncbi:DUF605-domain-containing protein [Hypoxylon fragiforme]|uniref:DUF605-domain-containing protein n=1 Tax=Hypoxylon fragiforme TaxID=63214 RepID=UPI0020C62A00|nr:DUF605-domain-containing protein [Hypoxylon fragiforme]KAI2604179.1 DUF605-domain-containing protein [Hypoxylon fragiforme]
MASNIPPKIKQAGITPFIIRANQLETAKPVIAYWCFYWAVNQILGKGLHSADDESLQFTTNLMERLEQIKGSQVGNDAIHDDAAGQAYVEQFAQETFERAIRPLKANKVTQQTASTFEAAATFYQLVNIWGTPDAETQGKIKYAKWNAARILKAIKEGKDPNESNPKQEENELDQATPALDPNDPEVQMIKGAQPRQPTVEEVPDEDASRSYQPFPAPVSAPTSPTAPVAPGPEQVSPIAPPSVPTPEPGGYFPSTGSAPDTLDLPSMSDMPPPGTAPYNPVGPPPVLPSPSSHQPGEPPSIASTPQDFYRREPTPPVVSQGPSRVRTQAAPPNPPASTGHNYYTPPPQPVAPAQQYGGNNAPSNAYNTDDMAIVQAQKHAKWAISALNFEDVSTAVRELQAALATLGAR